MSWLLRLLPYVLDWLLGKLTTLASYLFAIWKNKQHDSELDKAAEEVKQAGTDPSLTPEQKAKEQEDAFDHLFDTTGKP